MTKTRFFAPLAAAALLAAPAFAKTQDSETGAAGGARDKSAQKICKRFENSASRMRSEKLCLTKAEWKKFEQEQQ